MGKLDEMIAAAEARDAANTATKKEGGSTRRKPSAFQGGTAEAAPAPVAEVTESAATVPEEVPAASVETAASTRRKPAKSKAEKQAELAVGGTDINPAEKVNTEKTPDVVETADIQEPLTNFFKDPSVRTLIFVTLDDIEVDPEYNAREMSAPENKAHLKYITDLIRNAGEIQEPLTGRFNSETGKYILKRGHTRRMAAETLAKEGMALRIPFIPDIKEETDVQRLYDLVTSNSGKQLSMLEQSAVARTLFEDKGIKKAEIARNFGVTQSNIDHLLKLAEATEKTKGFIRSGKVSASVAIELIRSVGSEVAEAELEEMVAKDQKITKAGAKAKGKLAEEDELGEEADGEDEAVEASGVSEVKSISLKKVMDNIDFFKSPEEKESFNQDKVETLLKMVNFFKGKISERAFYNFMKK